jgi:poly(3-hydroxybutyrate) depolymerase
MMRSMNLVLALLAVLVFSGCSSPQKSGSTANSVSAGSGGAGMGVAGGNSGSALAGTTGSALAGTTGTQTGTSGTGSSGTGTSGTGTSGTGTSGAGASGTGASGTGASGTGAAGAGSSGNGTGGNTTTGAGAMTGAPPPTTGDCVGDWNEGTHPADFITGGNALSGSSSLPAIGGFDYAVHVPKGYDCHLPTPILYGLHGLGMNGYSFNVAGSSTPMRTGGLVAKADEAGFILVMPTGMGPTADAVKAVRDIFKNLETHLNIDHKRVYATGHSFGGSLSFLLACTAADLFTAVAPNAWTMLPASCAPAQPISVLASDGDKDAIAPGGGNLTPAITTLAKIIGCSEMETPATVPASGGDTTCVTHAGCKGGVEVTACTITGGGHTWFGDPTCGTGADACDIVGANSAYYVNTDFAWDFLKRFSR